MRSAAFGLAAQQGCSGADEDALGSAPSASDAALPGAVPAPAAPGEHPEPASRIGSAIARSPAGDRLYVAHEDLGVLRTVALPLTKDSEISELKLPGAPAAVVAVGDRVFVTVRSPGLLMAFRADTAGLSETGRVSLPDDAWGLGLTSDDKTALVTSAWTHKVSAIDIATMTQSWSLDVGREPRGIAFKPGDKSAYVTHLVSGGLTRIDDIDTASPRVSVVALPAAPLRTPKARAELAKLAYAPVLSPEGDRLFVPRQALGADGIIPWNGMATVDTMLLADESPLAVPSKDMNIRWTGDFSRVFGENGSVFAMHEQWLTAPAPTQRRAAFLVARAAIYRKSTRTLLIADEGGDDLVELDAQSVDPSLKPLNR